MLTVNFSPFPTLYTERLQLREMTDDDVDALFEMRSNPIHLQYIGRPLAQTLADAQALIDKIRNALANNEGITWAVTLKDNPKLIGTLGFWRIDKENHRTEIGYMLHMDYQGKGLMREAIETGLQYAFKTMDVHTVEAVINPANAASLAVAERCGFEREGLLRDVIYHNGKFFDACYYSIINPYHKKQE